MNDNLQPAAATNGQGPEAPGAADPSLLGTFNVLLRHRILILGLMIGFGALWVAIALASPRTYTSVTSFVPQSRSQGPTLPGVVAQLGLNLPAGERTMSPDFYVDLVKSRVVLGTIASDTFQFRDEEGREVHGTLDRFYDVSEERPEIAREQVIKHLQRDISVGAHVKTGVVTVAVRAVDPSVAHQIADRLLTEIHDFNLRSRQRQAAEDRRFAEQRLAELRVELRNAEDRLQSFMETNRSSQAPRLVMQRDRLEREVSMQQSLYTALAQSYGQAKIEEHRDTPVISTVQPPERPVLPDRRRLPVKLLIGLILGGVIGAVIAFLKDYFERSRAAAPQDFEEFARLRQLAVGDILHPWRPIGRAFSGRRQSTGVRG